MRRVLIALLLLCPPAFAQQSRSLSQSTSFRSDPAHTGVYNSSGVPKFHRTKWQFKMGGRILSPPVVSDGTVYFGSDDPHLYALDSATGAERWKFKTGGRIVCLRLPRSPMA